MHHTIEFLVDLVINIESSGDVLERVFIFQGTRLAAQLKPYVVEAGDEFVEVADLFFEDGTAVHGIPFALFVFVD